MARWYSCNILQPGNEFQKLWQFTVGSKFNLLREEIKRIDEPLPEKVIGKDWQTLFQPKLNVALLPSEKVFLRVVQLPKAEYAETQSMVELQLEKLSPLPVTQLIWGFELLSAAQADMQTAIVIMVDRDYVNDFLKTLEVQGFMADRLELPFLDLLRATNVTEDGVWIYTDGVGPNKGSCLVAWWYGGTLQNLSLVHLPTGATSSTPAPEMKEGGLSPVSLSRHASPGTDRGALLQAQLAQMAWAGEFDGWLTAPPKYHLVASPETADVWKGYFRSDQPVEVETPLMPAELAELTARRVATENLRTNLLPPDYAARYRQQFIDRLWMRGVGAVLMVYVAVAGLYLGWVQFTKWQCNQVKSDIAENGLLYTNALTLKARVGVLQEQRDLQFAALDCWKAVADQLPAELTLKSLSFDRGKKLVMMGTAANEDFNKVVEFNKAMRNVTLKDQLLFSKVAGAQSAPAGGNLISWSFTCELKRTGIDIE